MEDERLASLKAMEAFTGVEVQVREFCSDWILLTYDIPCSEKGNKARAEFLKKAKQVGAMPHTESVYLLPWTPQSESIALDVASVGDAFLWISKVKDEAVAIGLTAKYDKDISKMIKELGTRLEKIEGHWQDGKEKLAKRMMSKTWDKVNDLQGAIVRRGSVGLYEKMVPLVEKLRQLGGLSPVAKSRSTLVKKQGMVYNPATKRFERPCQNIVLP